MSRSWLYKKWGMLSWGSQIQEHSERGWKASEAGVQLVRGEILCFGLFEQKLKILENIVLGSAHPFPGNLLANTIITIGLGLTW